MDSLAFVAAAQPPVQPQTAALRGAAELQAPRGAAPGFSTASALSGLVAAAAGAAAVARAGARKSQKGRRVMSMRAAAGAAALEVEEEAPPPFDPAQQVGATAPLGFWDPLGFCKVGDYPEFHKLRSAEIKHGRVAMMAAFGTAFAHFAKFPGFDNTPAGIGAITDPIGVLGMVGLALPIGLVETVYWKDDDLSKEPGNFGDPGDWAGLFGAFGGGYSDEIRNKEINNGRMAMISVMGILVAEIATGKDGIQQFGV